MDLPDFEFETTVDLIVDGVMIAADIDCRVMVSGDWMDWDDAPQFAIDRIVIEDFRTGETGKLILRSGYLWDSFEEQIRASQDFTERCREHTREFVSSGARDRALNPEAA
jgi:hypothetical protein